MKATTVWTLIHQMCSLLILQLTITAGHVAIKHLHYAFVFVRNLLETAEH